MRDKAYEIWQLDLRKKLSNLIMLPKNLIKLEDFSKSNFYEEFSKNKTTKEVCDMIEKSFEKCLAARRSESNK